MIVFFCLLSYHWSLIMLPSPQMKVCYLTQHICCVSDRKVDFRKGRKETKHNKKGHAESVPSSGSDGWLPDMGALCIWPWTWFLCECHYQFICLYNFLFLLNCEFASLFCKSNGIGFSFNGSVIILSYSDFSKINH